MKRHPNGTWRGTRQAVVVSEAVLKARWLESETIRLKLMGLSFDKIALQITHVGRRQAQAIVKIPDGVTFAPDFQISRQACHKAFKRAFAREPSLAAEEFRKLDTDRCEEMLLNLQSGIRKGNPRSIEVGIKVLDHSVKINGYAAQKHELTGKNGKELGGPNGARIPIAVVREMLADIENQELARDERASGGDLDDDDGDALPESVDLEAARASLAEEDSADG
jgi:hypothetical protein